MGITNELFQTERDENPTCQFATVPNDVTDTERRTRPTAISAIEKFAFFMRFLAPPTPVPDLSQNVGFVTAGSIADGRRVFESVGCALCHTPTLRTGNATVAALANQDVNLFSDLGVHDMGPGLADDVQQGQAAGDEFRTAPLWGLGQRIFFLHDGRTTDLRGGDPGSRERGQPEVRAVGGQPRDRQLQQSARKRQAGPAELPALALADPPSNLPRAGGGAGPGERCPGPARARVALGRGAQ